MHPSILLIGSGMPTSLENMYLRAFRRYGYPDVHLFDLEPFVPALCRRRYINRLTLPIQHAMLSSKLVDFLCKSRRKFNIIIVFKGMAFPRRSLEQCRRLAGDALWVNINPDDPFNVGSPGASNRKVVETIPFYDLYCIWSRCLVEKLHDHGAQRVTYLPFGYDEEFHQSAHCPVTPSKTVSFVGSWDAEREGILTALAGHELVVYGNGWGHVPFSSVLRQRLVQRDLFGEELAAAISGPAVSLNLLRPQNAGSHNMRTFEIPAMGGLMLTNRTGEQQEFFPEDEACYMYGDLDELRAKIDHILAHPQETARVRARGMELVQAHSYVARVKSLMQELM